VKLLYYKFSGGGGRNSYGGYQDQGPPEEVGYIYMKQFNNIVVYSKW
jgi:hypothetical protein